MIDALIKDTAKEKIGDALGIDLKGLTGGKKEATQQQTQPSQEQQQIAPKDPVKEILDGAGKKLLDKLF